MEDGTAGGNRHAVDDDRALELAAKPVAGPMLTSVDSLNGPGAGTFAMRSRHRIATAPRT